MEQILPVIDTEILQQKATEFAMKGAIASIQEYYTGYGSPFKAAIDANLKSNELKGGINLPDIIALINATLSKEIDIIANTAVSKSFVSRVSVFLTREEKQINFSHFLKKFIEYTEATEYDQCSVEVEPHSYGWLNVTLNCTLENLSRNYRLTFHEVYESKKEPVRRYQLLSLPHDTDHKHQTMKIIGENHTLEIPFVKDVLSDEFTSYCARLIMSKSEITMDTKDFDEDMFPQDECHCN